MSHNKSPGGRVLFLTGASGLLGTALLESARARDIVALCHSTSITRPGVETFKGDVCKPLLGLSEPDYEALASRIDVVVHSASITRFGVSDARMIETNVEGTREIVKLAHKASARLVYISTAFVHAEASDLAPVSMYEESKRQAEAIVRTLGDNYVIIRPSIIVGDSRTGRAAAYQGLHDVVGSMIDRSLPVLPTKPEMLCDFVAQDWVTDAIWAAVSYSSPARELWITSGIHALSVEAIVAVALRVGDSHGFRGAAPKIVPYDTLERLFIPVFLESLPSRLRRRFQANLKMARYMNQKAALPSSEAYLRTTFRLPARETPEAVLVRNMEHWCTHRRASGSRTMASAS